MYSKENLEKAVKNSISFASLCRYLGLQEKGSNFKKLKNDIKEYNLDISHFKRRYWNTDVYGKSKPLKDILVENCFYPSSKLRNRLIKEGLKELKCEKCNRTEWEGEPIPLQLHHKNGNHYDNRIENLAILCSNCHDLEHTSKSKVKYNTSKIGISELELEEEKIKIKNLSNKEKIEKPKRYCLKCGKELNRKQTNFCSNECSTSFYSKKPDKETLINILEENNYNLTKTGKIFDVSANAIKKWCKSYCIEKNNFFHSKKISQFDLDGNFIKEYNSITQAMNETKITNINVVLQKKRKTAGGYIWRYSE